MPPKQSLEAIYSSYLNKEKGLGKVSFWDGLFGGEDPNPDNINITTYEKMLLDAQVWAASRVRNLAVLSKGIDLEYHGEDKELGLQMKKYLRKAFTEVNRSRNMNGGMYFILDQMLHNGTGFGYSVAETVFGDYNEFEDGYVYPRKVKVLPPKTLKDCFSISDMGDLEKVTQNRNGQNPVVFSTDVDLDRLIVYTHGRTFSNWYGQSDLKVIYKNWFIKDYLIKFWNIMLERYGAPFLLGKVSNPANIDAMDTALDSARTKTNFSIWANDDVSILEPTSANRDAFLSGVKYHDGQIMLGKLVPLLIVGIGDTGARALGDVHFRVFLWTVKNDQKEVSDFMDLWIRKLIDMNFENVDAYPHLTFPVIANEDLTAMSDALFKLINTQVVAPDEAWIRDMLSIPEDDLLESTGGLYRSEDEVLNPNPTGWRMSIDGRERRKREAIHRESTRQERKLTYDPSIKVLEKMFDVKERQVMKIYTDYLDIQKKKVLRSPHSFKREMRETQAGLITKLKVLLNGWGEEVIDFDDAIFDGLDLEANTSFSRKGLKKHINTLATQSFKESVAEVAFKAKDVVLDGQALGLTNAEIATEVGLVYETYTRSQLTSVVRTIVNDVNNAARLDLYRNNSDFVNGLRYDAILDKRTTDFCDSHDGMQLPLNHPDVDALRPPNHFRCRSLFIPVTILDGPFKTTYRAGDIYPDERFGGLYFENKYGEGEFQ